jgi:hypothetical protein
VQVRPLNQPRLAVRRNARLLEHRLRRCFNAGDFDGLTIASHEDLSGDDMLPTIAFLDGFVWPLPGILAFKAPHPHPSYLQIIITNF